MDHWTSIVGFGLLTASVGFGAAFWPSAVEFRDLNDDLEFCQMDLVAAQSALKARTTQATLAQGRWQDWQGWAEDANKARNALEAELGKTRTELFAARAYQEGLSQRLLAALAKSDPSPEILVIPAPIRKAEVKSRKRRYASGKKKVERQDVHSWAWF